MNTLLFEGARGPGKSTLWHKFPQLTTDELRSQIQSLNGRVLAIKRSKKERKANKPGLSMLESTLHRMRMELTRREGLQQ